MAEPAGSSAEPIELGAVRGAYGVRGWVRVAPFATDGGVLEAVDDWWLIRGTERHSVTVQSRRRHGSSILAKLTGCETKEAADALKGATVAVARNRFPPLPEGQHYLGDLLGSRVVNRTGEALGVVSGLRANEVAGVLRQWLEVMDGIETRLIPLVEPFVDEVDVAAKVVRVDWQRDW